MYYAFRATLLILSQLFAKTLDVAFVAVDSSRKLQVNFWKKKINSHVSLSRPVKKSDQTKNLVSIFMLLSRRVNQIVSRRKYGTFFMLRLKQVSPLGSKAILLGPFFRMAWYYYKVTRRFVQMIHSHNNDYL